MTYCLAIAISNITSSLLISHIVEHLFKSENAAERYFQDFLKQEEEEFYADCDIGEKFEHTMRYNYHIKSLNL